MKRQQFFTGILFIIFLLFGCIKEEVSQIESAHFTWTPDLAIPFGSPEIPMEEYVSQLETFIQVDTVGKTIDSLIYYEQHFFDNPFTITYTTNLEFNLGDQTENPDYFTSAIFRINAINRIPASIALQVYFTTNFQILDSLFNNGPLPLNAAPVNEEGIVTGAFEPWKNDVEFNSEKILMLSKVTQIEIKTVLTIPKTKTQFIQYLSNQNVWIQLGGRFKLKVPL